MKTLHFVAAAIACLAIGIGAYLGLAADKAAPHVRYTLLDGSQTDVAQLRGKVVLVNFWATSCTACVREMPQIVALHERFKSAGYDTLAVAMHYDPPSLAAHFAETRGLPFGVAIDNTGAIARSFGNVQLTPTSVLINRRGEIVGRFVGEPDFSALSKIVESLLDET